MAVLGDVLDEAERDLRREPERRRQRHDRRRQGIGTITDNDATPTLAINNVTVTEGNTGTVNAVFTVTLSAASGQTVTVNYATANGTAHAPARLHGRVGHADLRRRPTTQTITVPVARRHCWTKPTRPSSST